MDESNGEHSAPPATVSQPPTDGILPAGEQDGGAAHPPAAQQDRPAQQPAPGASPYPAPSAPSAPFAPPTYPGMPGVPLSWSTYPPAPSGSQYASAATNPFSGSTPASLPANPVYPGGPSVPLGSPMQGAYPPMYPGYPASYPGYPASYPGAPMTPYGAPLTVPLQQADSPLRRALAEPFPVWLSAALVAGAVALVAVAYLASVLAGQEDWADGAGTAGLVAVGLAFVGLIVAIVRGALGRRAVSMLVMSAVLVVGLSAIGATGVFASPQIHGFQAHALEGSHDWQDAVHEYTLSGEQAPNAPDIARTLDEQGEQQLANGQYAAAIATFRTVSTQYDQAGDPVGRANTDTFNAYSAWVKSQAGDVAYFDAITFFESYRTAASCSASCQGAVAAIEPQARYQYGEQLLGQSAYSQAIGQFEAIATNFSSSSYASQAHEGAAQAYLGYGKQELASECPTPLPYGDSPTAALAAYRTLSTTYADTPEGQQAKTALAAPQDAVGNFQKALPSAVIYLSKNYSVSTGDASNDYVTAFSTTSSTFTFHNIAQGSYYMTYTDNTGASYYIGTQNNPVAFPVGPLCATDLGEILN